LLEFLAADEKTKTIAVYLEGLKSQGRKFVETVKKVVKKKAVVVLKAGKSKKGMEAVVSHTGSLAGEARIFSAVAKQFGLIEAETWEELFDFSKALAMQPLPKGDKLLVVTNGGGFGVLAADEAEKQGLHLAELPEEMKKILRKNLARYASLHNPLDLTADADAEKYELAVSEGLKYFDGVVVVLLFQVPSLADTVADAVIALQRAEKPIICCAAGSSFTQQQVERLEKFGIPVYPTPERAVKAFSVLLKRANFLLKRQK
jgi:acyl-CoA synthetase (NDP forming)